MLYSVNLPLIQKFNTRLGQSCMPPIKSKRSNNSVTYRLEWWCNDLVSPHWVGEGQVMAQDTL